DSLSLGGGVVLALLLFFLLFYRGVLPGGVTLPGPTPLLVVYANRHPTQQTALKRECSRIR
ncbi:hypothetical protein, partial [Klebsiella pneumoniae]|uniref:hypothetical protein n=1 Tax=Klebsiella pneumoniae TaxID=573 RepID=UPI00301DD2C0